MVESQWFATTTAVPSLGEGGLEHSYFNWLDLFSKMENQLLARRNEPRLAGRLFTFQQNLEFVYQPRPSRRLVHHSFSEMEI